MPTKPSGANNTTIPQLPTSAKEKEEKTQQEGNFGPKTVKQLADQYENMIKQNASGASDHTNRSARTPKGPKPPVPPKPKDLHQRLTQRNKPTQSLKPPPVYTPVDKSRKSSASASTATQAEKRPDSSFTNDRPQHENITSEKQSTENNYSKLSITTPFTPSGPYSLISHSHQTHVNADKKNPLNEGEYHRLDHSRRPLSDRPLPPTPEPQDEKTVPFEEETVDSSSHYSVPRNTPLESPPHTYVNLHEFETFPGKELANGPYDEDTIYESIDYESIEGFSPQQQAVEVLAHELKSTNEQLNKWYNELTTLYKQSQKHHTRTVKKTLNAFSTFNEHKNYRQFVDLLSKGATQSLSEAEDKNLQRLTKWMNKELQSLQKRVASAFDIELSTHSNTTTGLHLSPLAEMKESPATPREQAAKDLLAEVTTLEQEKFGVYKDTLGIMQTGRHEKSTQAKKALATLNGVNTHENFHALIDLLEKAQTNELTPKQQKVLKKQVAWFNKQITPALKLHHGNSSAAINSDLLQLPAALRAK